METDKPLHTNENKHQPPEKYKFFIEYRLYDNTTVTFDALKEFGFLEWYQKNINPNIKDMYRTADELKYCFINCDELNETDNYQDKITEIENNKRITDTRKIIMLDDNELSALRSISCHPQYYVYYSQLNKSPFSPFDESALLRGCYRAIPFELIDFLSKDNRYCLELKTLLSLCQITKKETNLIYQIIAEWSASILTMGENHPHDSFNDLINEFKNRPYFILGLIVLLINFKYLYALFPNINGSREFIRGWRAYIYVISLELLKAFSYESVLTIIDAYTLRIIEIYEEYDKILKFKIPNLTTNYYIDKHESINDMYCAIRDNKVGDITDQDIQDNNYIQKCNCELWNYSMMINKFDDGYLSPSIIQIFLMNLPQSNLPYIHFANFDEDDVLLSNPWTLKAFLNSYPGLKNDIRRVLMDNKQGNPTISEMLRIS